MPGALLAVHHTRPVTGCVPARSERTTVPTSRAIRDPERKKRILDAAADLIAKHGFLGVNLNDIGAAAGIVSTGIYRHFDSKAAILVGLFDRVVDRLIRDAEAALRASEDPAMTLGTLVRGQVQFTIEERQLCQVYLQEARNLPEGDQRTLRWKQRHYIDLWQDVLGAIRPELSQPQRQLLVHAAISGMHSVLRFHSPLPEDQLAASMESIARHTLGLDAASSRSVEPAGSAGRPGVPSGSTLVAS
jgi:AcrR family transcriptional regulator